ncbi:MAG: caspase family protein, partial [Chryseolinea sp.]
EAPTFANLTTQSFTHFQGAIDGDICLFYYSGHGSHTDAPEIFRHLKSDGQQETIVCLDSRDPNTAGSRDIIDVELGYMLWTAIKDKNVHTLVIMDCCHSGNGFRSMREDRSVRYRYESPADGKIPFEKYIGYGDDEYYKIEGGKARTTLAKYVMLASCQDFEKSLDTSDGGLFTLKLIESLRADGTSKSYRDLMKSLAISIGGKSFQQNPVPFANPDGDLDYSFLGGRMMPFNPQFIVQYDFDIKQWLIFAGSLHGLKPSQGNRKTRVRVSGLAGTGTINKVFGLKSILEPDQELADLLNKDNERQYRAILIEKSDVPMHIGVSEYIANNPGLVETLRKESAKFSRAFYEVYFDNNYAEINYTIKYADDGNFALMKVDSNYPVFARTNKVDVFFNNIEKVGKWLNISETKSNALYASKDDFVFKLERIEGSYKQAQTSKARNELTGKPWDIEPNDDIEFNYRNDSQPAFKLSISLSEKSRIQECFVGAVYLQALYGIYTDFIKPDGSRLVKKQPLTLGFLHEGAFEETIPLALDSDFAEYNVNEIAEVLKIYISSRPFDVSGFKQENLKPELDRVVAYRSIAIEKTKENTVDPTQWNVFDFKFHIIGPAKTKEVSPNATVDFRSFTLTVNADINATAFASTANDINAINKVATRGWDKGADAIHVSPPESIWGDNILSERSAFASGLSASADNEVQMLQLTPKTEGEILTLNEGEELIIDPAKPPFSLRSIENFEDTTVPYGFDPESGLWFPVGYSDEHGKIHISILPPATPGDTNTRSLGGSVKLFFKKIFRPKKSQNSLVLYEISERNKWTEIEPQEVTEKLKSNPTAKVLLLLHGVTGDTKHMVEALKITEGISAKAGFVLTYDYENLATPIEDTAEKLLTALTQTGLTLPGSKRIVIIAHSMGGMIARWLVEHLNGNTFVNKLILVGTASAGSELAKLGTTVFGLLTHALNVTGPIKYMITGLSFLLKTLKLDPGKTLKQTNPGSDFLIKLSKRGKPDDVTYAVIGGDTMLIDDKYDDNDPFLKRLVEKLKNDALYPALRLAVYKGEPNDMAVTLVSMQAIAGLQQQDMTVVASNHLAYFRQNLCQKELLEQLS